MSVESGGFDGTPGKEPPRHESGMPRARHARIGARLFARMGWFLPQYSSDEIARHNRPGDCWISFGGLVYDVSEWMKRHPGGAVPFLSNAGHDATTEHAAVGHSPHALALAKRYLIGRVCSISDDEKPRDIPYAVRWLVPKGERFANFDILNDNDTQLDYYRRFGHIYAVGIPTKKWRIVMVSDPELLDEVASNEEQFGKREEEINFFRQLQATRGTGISVIGDSEYYERVRRVMLPWYSPANQRAQFPMMVEEAQRLVEAWSRLSDDEPIDAVPWIERYTLSVSGRGACNYDFRLFSDGEPRSLAAAVTKSTKESVLRVAQPWPDFTLFSSADHRRRTRQYHRYNRELFATADALVRGRVGTCPAGPQTDLLTQLLTGSSDSGAAEALDSTAMRDQILMHLSNGFNGPSITGAWLAYVLATRPAVEAKVIAEVDAISGGDPGYALQYDDLTKLRYTTQVIKETLRIYPPMPVTIRRALKDGMLGRYRIRKGDIILVGTLAAQRDPRYWGPNPDEFDPEHFATEKVAERPRHAFIPFSVGRRQCMAQEVTFMMLRVLLFHICNRYRLRLPPAATVKKNTIVTTKPVAVPVIRLLREGGAERQAALRVSASRPVPAAVPAPRVEVAPSKEWDRPSEIPPTSAYRRLVVAYGSNFGTNKGLAERFAERSKYFGYTSEVATLNDLAEAPERTQPWLLVVMTSTYTANPPANAVAFKAWLDRLGPGAAMWRNCRYLVWGLGNTQWNAFLAFPRYVHARLGELGATAVRDLGYADVGTLNWEQGHAAWLDEIWPALIGLSGARPTEAAARRVSAERAEAGRLTAADSTTAMTRSLGTGGGAAPRVLLAPQILTNAVGANTFEVRAVGCRELQAAESTRRTRHLELSLPPDVSYRAGDHIAICPKNDEDRVERLAQHLGAVLDGLFMVPKSMNVQAVPKGVVLQVRNALTNLVDIAGLPTVALLDLLVSKTTDPVERSRLGEIRDVLATPQGAASPLRDTIRGGGYDLLELLEEFPSSKLNIFEFLQVAQPLRPRYYSTSSSPRVHGGGLAHLTIGLETVAVPGRDAREFRGMSAHYAHSLRVGDRVNVFLDSADGFHLQEDIAKPMMFVSVGTGFAPMRAFLWERLARMEAGERLGEAVLFNGIRSRDEDFIYREEIEEFASRGVLDHAYIVASRERPGCREHVQDRICAEASLVWRLLSDGGYVYVCGSKPMRDGVRSALVDIAMTHGELTPERAESYLADLENTQHRYRPDLWV